MRCSSEERTQVFSEVGRKKGPPRNYRKKERSGGKRQCQHQKFEYFPDIKESQMEEIERDVLVKRS